MVYYGRNDVGLPKIFHNNKLHFSFLPPTPRSLATTDLTVTGGVYKRGREGGGLPPAPE